MGSVMMLERDWDNHDEQRWSEQTNEVRKIYAANRAHHWNSSTTVIQAIRDRLVADQRNRD
jgi:hypothetical protein